MYPHRIRLRGPWECEPLERLDPSSQPASLPSKVTMTLPCRWGEGGLKGFAGRVRYQRRFGWPGRLDPHEHVWLTFADVEGTAEVWLNGTYLGRWEAAGPFEWEVTSLLQIRNQLTVEVAAAGDHGGPWGAVALEVRGPAYLRAVRATLTPAETTTRLRVRGEVVGTWPEPLELYALLDGANLLYATVAADPAGQPFDLVSDELTALAWRPSAAQAEARHEVCVELVQVTTVWYRVEGRFSESAGMSAVGIGLHPPD